MNKYFAELVGTFVLVFGGVGSAVLAGSHIGFAGISAAFGLSLLAMVYTIGPISGCHVNPAVTLGVFLAKKINAKDAGAYMVAQVIGAIIASGVILFIANGLPGGYSASVSGLGADGYGLHSPDHYSLAAGFVAETVLTMFLVLTVLGSDRHQRSGWFCRLGHRPGADPDSPGWHSHHQHFGQPGAQHRSGALCRRLGVATVMDVYRRAVCGRGRCRDRLCRPSPSCGADHHPQGRASAAWGTDRPDRLTGLQEPLDVRANVSEPRVRAPRTFKRAQWAPRPERVCVEKAHRGSSSVRQSLSIRGRSFREPCDLSARSRPAWSCGT